MRYFFSTGEPSGELVAVTVAHAIAKNDSKARFEGIGAQRMRQASFELYADHSGWASMGPLAAIPRIPKLLTTMWRLARDLAANPPDLLVLVDFGAFNVRLAAELREKHHYLGAILYIFPPGAWLDRQTQARRVASLCTVCPGYAHQADFYASLGLTTLFFGHPLVGQYALRPARSKPNNVAGSVAVLPGSRKAEVRAHMPRLLGAVQILRQHRPELRVMISAANRETRREIERAIQRSSLANIGICDGSKDALEVADAAWIASGTAVLEATLLGVPSVVIYVLSPLLVRHARRVYRGRFIALPNLMLGREVIPELLQDDATPQALCAAMERLLCDPDRMRSDMRELHVILGDVDAAQRIALAAVELARTT